MPESEIGLTTEAEESTESSEVGIPAGILRILCVLCGTIPDSGDIPKTEMRTNHRGGREHRVR